MGNRTNRLSALYLLRAMPYKERSLVNLQEAGLLPFEITLIPERSCKWPHLLVSAANSNLVDANNARLLHPFVVVTIRLTKICGMACTSNVSTNDFDKLKLPFDEPRKVRWYAGHTPKDTYVALDPWFLSYSEILFQNAGGPKKIGQILDKDIRATINSVVKSSSQAQGETL